MGELLPINETLSRTSINRGKVVLTTIALFLFGGPVIHSFAFALLAGLVVSEPIVLYLVARRCRVS